MTQTLDRDSVVVAGPWRLDGSPDAAPGLVGIVAAGELLADPAAVEPAAVDPAAVEPAAVEPDAGGPVGGSDRGVAGLRLPAAEAGRLVRPNQRSVQATAGRRPVRLTRRGRMVVLAALIVLAGAIAALAALPSQAADPAGPTRVVVVRPGDSLWTIVERYRPGADPVRAVEELIRVNDLPGTTVYAGEELTLPSRW